MFCFCIVNINYKLELRKKFLLMYKKKKREKYYKVVLLN